MCLHIINGLQVGGAERSLHSLLAGGLIRQGEQHVVSLTDLGVFGPRIEALGVPVYSLGLRQGRSLPTAAIHLRSLVHRIHPDLIQGWMYHGNFAASFAQRAAPKRPLLVWNIRHSLDDLTSERFGIRLAIRVNRLLSGNPDSILYNSNRSRAQHEVFGYAGDRARVIPNGFDTRIWCPNPKARKTMRSRLRLSEQDILVGFVARFHPMKDLANLLRAIGPLMSNDKNIRLVIVGSGNERNNPALTQQYTAIPSKNLHILGAEENVHDMYPGLDIFCLSSNSEAFPNVLGEAMACAVPCVATDVGDAGLVLGSTGKLVPSSDSDALRAALAEMIALSPEERINAGAAGRKRIVETFSLDATVQAYRNFYDKLLENT